jgi:hypothetical protein
MTVSPWANLSRGLVKKTAGWHPLALKEKWSYVGELVAQGDTVILTENISLAILRTNHAGGGRGLGSDFTARG